MFYKGDIQSIPKYHKEIDVSMPKISDWASMDEEKLEKTPDSS